MPNGTSVLGSARVEVLSVSKGYADMAGSQEEFVKHIQNRRAETEALLGSPLDAKGQSLVRTILLELDTAIKAAKETQAHNGQAAKLAAAIETRLRF